jgi:phage/plasmid-like protein (TIGR03299 family)
MPAEIANIQGRPAIAYYGEPPWHGLGKALQKPATAAEAIAAAQLAWDVTKVPLHIHQCGEFKGVPKRYGIVRADLFARNEPAPLLGIVGAAYTPLQNRDAFAWFDPIVGEQAAIYHTAGALGGGERVWILAKLPGDMQVIGDDIAHKFLLLSNSHDGSSAVHVKFTPVRVVCQNTLTMALRDGSTLSVPPRTLAERLSAARETLGIIRRRFDAIAADFQTTARFTMTSARLDNYLPPPVLCQNSLKTPVKLGYYSRLKVANRPSPSNARTVRRGSPCVQHGHQKGIIDRDLKPSNIMNGPGCTG